MLVIISIMVESSIERWQIGIFFPNLIFQTVYFISWWSARRGKQQRFKGGGAKNYQQFIADKQNKGKGSKNDDNDDGGLQKESSYVAYEITQNNENKVVKII